MTWRVCLVSFLALDFPQVGCDTEIRSNERAADVNFAAFLRFFRLPSFPLSVTKTA